MRCLILRLTLMPRYLITATVSENIYPAYVVISDENIGMAERQAKNNIAKILDADGFSLKATILNTALITASECATLLKLGII